MAAVELATAYISLVPSLKGANKSISDQLNPGAAAAGSDAGEKVGSGMLSRIGRIVTGVAIGNLVSNAVSSLSGMFTGFVKDAASASDATDKFKATLNFAGLDTSAIDAATKATQKYADQTVYDLPTIQNTTAQLAANGVKNYEGLTEAAGNLNAVAGGNADTFKSVALAITQTTGAGKLQTQNWMQLAEAVPGAAGKLQQAMKEAGAYTGNFNDAMANGQITADEFNAAIEKLGMQDGAVQAAKSTTTFEGAIGNLQATIEGGLTRTLNAAKPAITGAINLLTSGLGATFSKVGSLAQEFQNGMKGVASSTGLLATAGRAVDAFTGGWHNMGADIQASGWVGSLERAGQTVHDVFNNLIPIMQTFARGFKGIGGPDEDMTGPFWKLGNAAQGVWQQVQPILNSLGQLFVTLGPQILDLVGPVMQVAGAFSPVKLIFDALLPVMPQLISTASQLASAGLGAISAALPSVVDGIRGIVTVVSSVVSWLLQFNGLVQAVAIGIGIAVVGFKLYEGAVVAIQAVTKAWAVVQGILNVVMDANPISLIIIGIAALIAAIVLLVANWDTVVGFVSTVWGGFVNWIGDTLNSIGAWFASVWNGIASWIGGVINSIVQPIVTAWNWVASAIGIAINFYATIITNTFNAIAGFIGGIINAIVQPIVAAWTWVSNLVKAILIAFWQTHGAQLTAIWNTVVSIFSAVVNFIVGVWNNIVGAVTAAVTWVWNAVSTYFQMVWMVVSTIFNAVWGFISGVWNSIVGAVSAAVNTVWNVIVSIFNAVWGFISGVWNSIAGTIGAAVGAVWNWISSGFTQAWNFISTIFNQVASFIGGIWDGIIRNISGAIDRVVGFFSGMWDRITGFFSGAGTALFDVGKNMIQGLMDGAGSLLSTIGNFFLSMIPGWIVEPFKAALGIHSPSRVFRGFGQNIGQGLVLGLGDQQADVEANIRNLVTVPSTASAQIGVAAARGSAPAVSAASGGVTINGNVYGNPEDIVTELDARARQSAAVNGIRAIAMGAA
ncbi:MAG: tape measure protein [Sphingomicrobium sp.]